MELSRYIAACLREKRTGSIAAPLRDTGFAVVFIAPFDDQWCVLPYTANRHPSLLQLRMEVQGKALVDVWENNHFEHYHHLYPRDRNYVTEAQVPACVERELRDWEKTAGGLGVWQGVPPQTLCPDIDI